MEGARAAGPRRRAVAQRRAELAELGPQRLEDQLARGEQPAGVGERSVEARAPRGGRRGPGELAPGLVPDPSRRRVAGARGVRDVARERGDHRDRVGRVVDGGDDRAGAARGRPSRRSAATSAPTGAARDLRGPRARRARCGASSSNAGASHRRPRSASGSARRSAPSRGRGDRASRRGRRGRAARARGRRGRSSSRRRRRRAACPSRRRGPATSSTARAIAPVPATMTTPGSPPSAPRWAVTASSLTSTRGAGTRGRHRLRHSPAKPVRPAATTLDAVGQLEQSRAGRRSRGPGAAGPAASSSRLSGPGRSPLRGTRSALRRSAARASSLQVVHTTPRRPTYPHP